MRTFEQNWPKTSRVWRQFALMDSIMERTGVNVALAARRYGGTSMARARDTCLRCARDLQCEHWLETVSPLSTPPEFCPNAAFLRA